MTAISLYLDSGVSGAEPPSGGGWGTIRVPQFKGVHTFIADAVRRRGWDAITTEEAGRRGALDPDQLRFATEHGSAILTYNISDFPDLHANLLAR